MASINPFSYDARAARKENARTSSFSGRTIARFTAVVAGGIAAAVVQFTGGSPADATPAQADLSNASNSIDNLQAAQPGLSVGDCADDAISVGYWENQHLTAQDALLPESVTANLYTHVDSATGFSSTRMEVTATAGTAGISTIAGGEFTLSQNGSTLTAQTVDQMNAPGVSSVLTPSINFQDGAEITSISVGVIGETGDIALQLDSPQSVSLQACAAPARQASVMEL